MQRPGQGRPGVSKAHRNGCRCSRCAGAGMAPAGSYRARGPEEGAGPCSKGSGRLDNSVLGSFFLLICLQIYCPKTFTTFNSFNHCFQTKESYLNRKRPSKREGWEGGGLPVMGLKSGERVKSATEAAGSLTPY